MSRAGADWGEMEVDALKEVVNLGVGAAAGVLNEMTGSEILLSVPEIVFDDLPKLAATLASEIEGDSVSISQRFVGRIEGAATLVFTEQSSRKLVDILLGDTAEVADNPELEAEALEEIGNLVLNSALGALADEVTGELKVELPIVFKGSASRLLTAEDAAASVDAFLLRVALRSDPEGIGGMIVVTLNPGHLDLLRAQIVEFVDAAVAV